MKRFVFLGLIVFSFAQDKYLVYVNKLINYHFDLKANNIKAPFEIKMINKKVIRQISSKKVDIDLLSIFNNEAYVNVKIFLGNQLIKHYKKWVKVGDEIYGCKIIKITNVKVILKCKDKIRIETLNRKIPQIKEKR